MATGTFKWIVNFDQIDTPLDKQLAAFLTKRFPEAITLSEVRGDTFANVLHLILKFWHPNVWNTQFLIGACKIVLNDKQLILSCTGNHNWEGNCKRFEDLPLSFDRILNRLDRAYADRLIKRRRQLRAIGVEYRRIGGPAQPGDLSLAETPPLLLEDKQAAKPEQSLKDLVGGVILDLTGVNAVKALPTSDQINEALAKAEFPECQRLCDGNAACECRWQQHLANKERQERLAAQAEVDKLDNRFIDWRQAVEDDEVLNDY